jgi:hypothetical protein
LSQCLLSRIYADHAIAVHAVTAVWYCSTRCCALLNRTITNANSTTAATEALTAAGFAVLDMTVPGLELFAQSFGRPSSWPGPSGG